MRKYLSFIIVLFLLIPNVVSADTIHLKSGGSVEGVIEIETDDSVTVVVNIGKLTYPKALIESISKASDEENAKLKKKWEDQKHQRESEHEQWKKFAKEQEAKGLIFYDGEWVTKEEYERLTKPKVEERKEVAKQKPAEGKPQGRPLKIRVLFVGNSLTAENDLPKMISELAKCRNISMEYDKYTPGGYKLFQHASDSSLMKKINQGTWDFVVLQEQSQMPAFRDWQVEKEVYPYAQKLSQLVQQANPKARIVFYMTMARRGGDADNAKDFPEVGTYEGMQKRINFAYTHMARQNRAILAPVGMAWQSVRSDKPVLNLYGDDIHPNVTGSYLAACVFYTVLFRSSPVGLSHPQQVDDTTAAYLQRVAYKTVQSQPWDWK